MWRENDRQEGVGHGEGGGEGGAEGGAGGARSRFERKARLMTDRTNKNFRLKLERG